MTSPVAAPATTTTAAQRAELGHLLRRTGFGVTPAELDAAAGEGYAATVDRLLAAADGTAGPDPGATRTPVPDLGPEPVPPGKSADQVTRRAYQQALHAQQQALLLWWLDRMVQVERPMTEKLTWYWHGHWATSIQKVRSARMMLAQNQTLRSLGAGDFRTLARAMVRDPALQIWLDAGLNRKAAPNENLGRELMELFTLGVGHYTETDVRQAARALTGWRVDRRHDTSRLVPAQHDTGAKTILEVTADFDDRSLVDLLVSRPDSARFVVGRLWYRVAAPGDPPADTMARLLAAYGPGRNVTAVLRALLLDPAFRGPGARLALVKQPVEYVVGALRALGVRVPRTGPAAQRLPGVLRGLGQLPFAPPNVGGWPSGRSWLTTSAEQARLDFAQWLVRQADLSALAALPAAARVDAVGRTLGVDAWTARSRTALGGLADSPPALTALALVTPEYLVC